MEDERRRRMQVNTQGRMLFGVLSKNTAACSRLLPTSLVCRFILRDACLTVFIIQIRPEKIWYLGEGEVYAV